MYLEMATEEDKKMVENWKADADGILIFVRFYPLILCFTPTQWPQTGLFSAAVASLISVSIQGLQMNPQDTSNFYLSNIYQTLADPNQSNTSISPPSPPPFSPPNHAVWVNALWFLSLVISLTCALLATLLQQWARRYLKITQSRYSPHKRARIRAFFAEGVEKCLLPWAVDTLPTLLHISLFLFFAGLVVFLCSVHLTIFKLVLSWVGLCTALYGCITCMPIFRHDSPYYTPLSSPAWHIVAGILFSVYRFLRWFNQSVRFRLHAYLRYLDLENSYRKSLVRGMQKTAEETALDLPSEIDIRAFIWTFDCLDEDHELEHFFSGLPSFRSSKVVHDPLPSLNEEEKSKLYEGLRGLVDRTFSSDLLPAPVKDRRAMICAKAVDLRYIPNAPDILEKILSRYQYRGPLATTIAKILRRYGNNVPDDSNLYAQFAISKIIVTRQPFDDSWYILVSNELGLPETSLREYSAHGDSLSLVILIHVIRQQLAHFWKTLWPRHDFSFVLATASNLNVKEASPELQHEFCTLWNKIVNEAQHGHYQSMADQILGHIRHIYLALHQDSDSAPTQFSALTRDDDSILWEPSSYPVCKVAEHRSDSTPHIHDEGVSTTLAGAIPHDPNIPTSVPSLVSPYPLSSSSSAPLPVNETFTDMLPLDDQIPVPVSTQRIGQTTTEGRRIPTTSPVITCQMHQSVDPSGMTQSTTSSPSPESNASTSPPADIAVSLSRTPSGDLNILSSPSPVLDAIVPTGLFKLLFSRCDSV